MCAYSAVINYTGEIYGGQTEKMRLRPPALAICEVRLKSIFVAICRYVVVGREMRDSYGSLWMLSSSDARYSLRFSILICCNSRRESYADLRDVLNSYTKFKIF